MLSALLCLVLAPCQEAAEPARDQLLRLRDGRVLLAEVLEHDFEGLAVARSLDGARFRFAWSDLFPGESERMRAHLGYKIESSVPEVEADRLLLVNGQVLLGRVLASDPVNIELRTHNLTSLVPRARLAAPPEKVRVPATEVLLPEQFYQERALDVDDGDALAQYRFALELQAVFALERALERLALAEQLASAAGDEALLRRLAPARTSIQLSLANKDQAELLEQVRQLMNRERFLEAEEALARFGESYPDSAPKGDYLDLRDSFEERRVAAMERTLSRRWFTVATALLKARALERDAAVDQLLEWATNELPQMTRARLAEELAQMKDDLDLSEIDALWAARVQHGATYHQANFGNGTWILGEEKARAGLVQETEAADEGKSEAQKELEERMKRYLDNIERQRQQAAGDGEVTPEDWWRQAKASQRFQFLLAYYAEFSGDFEVTHVRFSYCASCGGQGFLTSLDLGPQGSRERRVPCPTCHQVQVQRGVTFR